MLNLSGLRLSLRSLCVQILKAVTSDKWLVARTEMRHRAPYSGTRPALVTRHSPPTIVLVLAALATSHSPLATAQTGFASLSGRVADHSGAVIQKADVTLKNLDTGVVLASQTNNDGIYSFPSVQPGSYVMRVQKQGFRSVDVTGLTLYTQDQLARNFSLAVGSASESITVSADTTNDSPAVSMTVTRDFLENTPLNGRSIQDLIALAPGTVSDAYGLGLFSVNGQRDDANYFTVDGVAANTGLNSNAGNGPGGAAGVLPAQTASGTTQALASVDSIQEFKMQTANYDAEFGRQPGGQIEITTRSGTNDTHGSLFDYFRNEALDANSWTFNDFNIPRQPERQNDFGGALGGPLTIPRLYIGKDRTFFFLSYEGLRLKLPAVTQGDVPTEQFRQVAAPSLLVFLNSIPLPNQSSAPDGCLQSQGFSCGGLYLAGASNPQTVDSSSARIDHVVNERIQVFGRYAQSPSKVSSINVSELDRTSNSSKALTAGVKVRIRPDLLSDLHFNYSSSRNDPSAVPIPVGGAVPYAESLLVPAPFDSNRYTSGSEFEFVDSNFTSYSLPQYGIQRNTQSQYNLVGSLSWLHRKHSVVSGFDYRRLSPQLDPENYGSTTYLGSMQSVELGVADKVFVFHTAGGQPIFQNLSIFGQDSWNVTTRFNVSYGVRWEFNPPPGAADGKYPLALTTGDVSTATIAPAGTPQYHAEYHNFAPRVGFAYQVDQSPSHPVAFRSAFGIFYDTGQSLGAAGYQGYPFRVTKVVSNVPVPPSAAALEPLPLNFPLIPPYPLTYAYDPHVSLPYTEQWTASLDVGVTSKNTATLSYVGNEGAKLLFTDQWGSVGFPGPNPSLASVYLVNNASSSNYNALEIQDRGYIAANMQVILSYTWAHARDNASTEFLSYYGFGPFWGNSDNDIRQVFNFAVNYKVSGSQSSALLKALTSGWSTNSRLTIQSGSPIDVNQGFYQPPDGGPTVNIRPNLVRGASVYLHNVPDVLGGWELNSAAFSPVPLDPNTGAPLEVGNLGRNALHGPNIWNINTSVRRALRLRDQLILDFSADAFNLLNHPNPGGIDNNLGDGPGFFGRSFGAATLNSSNPLYATGSARSLQLMLRLKF